MIVCSNKQDRGGIEGKFGVRVFGTYQTKLGALKTYARSDIDEDFDSDTDGEPPKHLYLDAVLVGAVLLTGIGLTSWVAGQYQ